MAPEKTLNVLFAAAEADPLVKIGDLGEAAGALARSLSALLPQETGGYTLDMRLVVPFHPSIRQKIGQPLPVASFSIPHTQGILSAQVYLTEMDQVPVYLLDGTPISMESAVYSSNPQLDGEKYTFFSLALLEMTRTLQWQPDIIHAHDWHTALAVAQLACLRKDDPFFKCTRSVLTVHNLPFMGAGAEPALAGYGIEPSRDERLPEWARAFPLPLGLVAADRIVAVSTNYAREILTPAFGCGLQDMLRSRVGAISGILNGLDPLLWNPVTDKFLYANYSAHTLDRRQANKARLQSELGLLVNTGIPLLVMVGRMDQQKGMDLLFENLPALADQPWQLVILGNGDPLLESASRSLEVEYSDRVRAIIRSDVQLAHEIFAAGDILLMPSRYEPCGMAQMIAMRYGCVPVARATGGLLDTIIDTRKANISTGFLFKEPTADSFSVALLRALAAYQNPPAWRALQEHGMSQDFSWHKSAIEYAHIYSKLMEVQI